uniref:Uncharacterized protein n=1 Tax=Macaca fascicularis TaxID=9541 RepID=A0A7N9CVZ6_MACFA
QRRNSSQLEKKYVHTYLQWLKEKKESCQTIYILKRLGRSK